MDPTALPLDADQLFSHQPFVRAVARALVRDEHTAQDVAQDTLLRALRSGPRVLAALPAWLARTARNRVLELRRADSRRQRREVAAVEHAVPVGEDVHVTCERLELQRDLIGAVLALDEPFRSVVLLRHYHGLEPAEIATRLGAKAPTVRTWLVRAHDRLREQLDRQRPRDQWLAVLLPVGLRDGARAGAPATTLAVLGLCGLFVATLSVWLAATGGAPSIAPHGSAALAAAPLPHAPLAPFESISATAAVGSILAQERQPLRVPEVLAAPAVLHNVRAADYEDRCFSFERNYGGMERKGKNKTGNDYEVTLSGGQLRVDTVTDDRSLIVDLGELRLGQLGLQPVAKLEGLVRAAAVTRYENPDDKAPPVRLPALLGHCYFVWTDDSDSDSSSLFEIVDFGERCVLDWHSTEDGAFGRGSVLSPAGGIQLSTLALKLRAAALQVRTDADAPLLLKQPRVVLQARSGAAGGNPCRIELGRGHSAYFDRISKEPIPFGVPATIDDDSIGYCEGGRIPPDQVLVITKASWRGDAIGDTNGGGCFHVRLGDTDLVKTRQSDGVLEDTWQGRVEIRPGQEDRVFLEISNSSRGEVVFEGHFEQSHR